MAVAYTIQNRALTVSLSGELDHHRVKGVIRELEGEIDRLLPQQLVVDCAGVTFMDSAGIAILLRLWQRMEELGEASTSGTCRSSRGGCSGRRAWPGSSPPNPSRKGVTHSHAELDPTLDELGDVKTAVSEAVTNAIVHAYPDALGKVELKLRLYPENEFEVVVRDWGVGIENIDQARTPLFTTGSEERAGMGFTIMESFMDSLKVRSQTGKGTTLTLRRKISHRLPKTGE